MSKSAVSRRFVAATTKALAELMARELSDLDVAVLMIDGLDVAGQCVVVALVITTDGTKVPGRAVAGRHREQDRGHRPAGRPGRPGPSVDGGVLCVIDGAKALAAGIKKVFGEAARGATVHLAQAQERGRTSAQGAGRHDRPATGPHLRPARRRQRTRRRQATGQTSSRPTIPTPRRLREGLDDMFTVRRLGVSGALAKTLTNTNCIESMISIASAPPAGSPSGRTAR